MAGTDRQRKQEKEAAKVSCGSGIVLHARRACALVRCVIGKDLPENRKKVVVVEAEIVQRLAGAVPSGGAQALAGRQQALFATPAEQHVAKATYEAIRSFERLPRSSDLKFTCVQSPWFYGVPIGSVAVQGSPHPYGILCAEPTDAWARGADNCNLWRVEPCCSLV